VSAGYKIRRQIGQKHKKAANPFVKNPEIMQWQRTLGGISGAISVGTGAYASHGLKKSKESEAYAKVFETGSRYQLIHSVMLAATPAICKSGGGNHIIASKVAGACFASGIALFSGSCYAVGLTEDRSNGKLAPIGGFALIGGWLSLALLRR